jgi:hypothetical protein
VVCGDGRRSITPGTLGCAGRVAEDGAEESCAWCVTGEQAAGALSHASGRRMVASSLPDRAHARRSVRQP